MRKINFNLFAGYDLSLDGKTLYHITYCDHTYCLLGVFEDLDDAIRNINGSPEEYDAKFPGERTTIGRSKYRGGGISQNVNAWTVLNMLSETIESDIESERQNIEYDIASTKEDSSERIAIFNTQSERLEDARMMVRKSGEFGGGVLSGGAKYRNRESARLWNIRKGMVGKT
jgi:hypothetical protein